MMDRVEVHIMVSRAFDDDTTNALAVLCHVHCSRGLSYGKAERSTSVQEVNPEAP